MKCSLLVLMSTRRGRDQNNLRSGACAVSLMYDVTNDIIIDVTNQHSMLHWWHDNRDTAGFFFIDREGLYSNMVK